MPKKQFKQFSYKETVQTFIRMKIFFGLIAQFGLVLGQVNREDFDEIAQVRFFEERRKKRRGN